MLLRACVRREGLIRRETVCGQLLVLMDGIASMPVPTFVWRCGRQELMTVLYDLAGWRPMWKYPCLI